MASISLSFPNAQNGGAVTDPALLAQLNADAGPVAPSLKPVQDPDLLSQLEASPSVGDTAIDAVHSFGTGIAKGAIGLAGLPSDLSRVMADAQNHYIVNPLAKKFGWDQLPEGQPSALDNFGSAGIQNAVEGVTGKFHDPQTTAGNYAQTVGEFVPGMFGGGATSAAKLGANFLTRAALPGIASEGAGQLTQGSSFEPLARLGGAVLGGAAGARAAAPKALIAPNADQLKDAATAAYQHPTVAALELHPSSTAYQAGKIANDLTQKGFRSLTAPQTFSIVDELKTTAGATAKVADVQAVKTALGKVAGNFSNPTEQAAANRAIRGIDDYLANLKPYDIAAGNGAAANKILNEAKGNYAAKSRMERFDSAEYRAKLNTDSAHSGANINNATRQAIKQILLSPKKMRGFSAEEKAMMEKVVKGTATGNIMRSVGKALSGKGFFGSHIAAASVGAAPFTHGMSLAGLAVPAGGFVAKKIGDRSTAQAIRQLDTMIGMRSPLGQSLPAVNPGLNPGVASLLSGLLELNSPDGARRPTR